LIIKQVLAVSKEGNVASKIGAYPSLFFREYKGNI